MYKIICINDKTGKRYTSGFAPDTLINCHRLVNKMCYHAGRTITIEPV